MSEHHEDSLREAQSSGQQQTSGTVERSGVVAPITPSHSYMPRPLEIAQSIRTLHEVHQLGGLTEEEFAQAKQQILETPSMTTVSSKSSKCPSCEKRKGRRHRKTSHGSSSGSSARSTRGSHRRARRNRSAGSSSTRHTRHSSSSSSSSSSGSSASKFIVVPRANVWRTLQSTTAPDGSRSSSPLGEDDTASPVVHSPLFAPAATEGATVSDAGAAKGAAAFGRRRIRPVATSGTDETPLATAAAGRAGKATDRHAADDSEETALLVRDLDSTAAGLGPLGGTPSPTDGGPTSRDDRRTSFVLDSGKTSSTQRLKQSFGAADSQMRSSAGAADRYRYGTFFPAGGSPAGTGGGASGVGGDGMSGGADLLGHGEGKVNLEPEHEVRVRYFNSRGGTGDRFSEVKLKEEELLQPFFLHKGVSSVISPSLPVGQGDAEAQKVGVLGMPLADSQVFQLETVPHLSAEEKKAWQAMDSSSSRSHSSSSSSSFLEQSLNWYWIDVTGRDPTRRRYNSALRFLTKRFTICESFLVDREHNLMLPQIVESPNHPGQYMLNLRVATHKISISDDSVIELTNRWIIIVDLRQHFVMTLHRVDTHSMAQLRSQWKRIMGSNEVSFQEFLLKIIDDALRTYELSLDVHADLLDRCESKLFANESNLQANDRAQKGAQRPRPAQPSNAEQLIDFRILHHFSGSSRSAFLRQLLDVSDRRPMNKMDMNSFLHHLHRRTSVQHRMLNGTQTVLQKAFTKLQLCSKEMADQMCSSCMELSGRALEVRDDAKTLLDLHISLQSFRTNELMAVLTRVSLFFTPCTFLAGVYGMNFRFMPELDWHWGYPAFWVACILVCMFMQRFIFRF